MSADVDVFMIDPPWPLYKNNIMSNGTYGRSKNVRWPYGILSMSQIKDLLQSQILNRGKSRHHDVFMWCVDRNLSVVELMMEDFGYHRHARFVWVKNKGSGVMQSVLFRHEFLLWYYTGPFKPVVKPARCRFATTIHAKVREHSRKPDEAYQMVQAFWPKAKRLDVFSREKRDGWQQWGNETNKFKK